MRELDRHLASIMRYQAKEYAMKGKIKSGITPDDVEKILGRARFCNEIYKVANMPGVAVGLAWTYVGGDIFLLKPVLVKEKAN